VDTHPAMQVCSPCPISEEMLESLLGDGTTFALKTALHQCLAKTIGTEDAKPFFESLSENGQRKQSVCGAVWRRGSIAYRCLDCEVDPTSAVCAECFQEGEHSGHDYRIVHTSSGCCDCGEPTAWKPSGFCKHHGVTFSPDGTALYLPRLPADLKKKLVLLLKVVCKRMRREVRSAMQAREKRMPSAELSEGSELIFKGAQQGLLGAVQEGLRKGADANAKDGSQFRTTALHWAAQGGHAPIVRLLLSAGAAVNATNAYRQTALQCAVFEGHTQATRAH
jgi:hypothetical protein